MLRFLLPVLLSSAVVALACDAPEMEPVSGLRSEAVSEPSPIPHPAETAPDSASPSLTFHESQPAIESVGKAPTPTVPASKSDWSKDTQGAGRSDSTKPSGAGQVLETQALDESGYWSDFDQSPLDPHGFTIRSSLGEMWPRFRTDVNHYAVKCITDGYLSVRVHAHDMRSAAETEGPSNPAFHIEGESREVAGDGNIYFRNSSQFDDLNISVLHSDGIREYTVHCLPADFPDVHVRNRAPVGEDLYAISLSVGNRIRNEQGWPVRSYLTLMDRNGVPRFQKGLDRGRSLFKVYPGDGVRAISTNKIGPTDDPWNDEDWIFNNHQIVAMNADFDEQYTVQTVGLRHTDHHDANMTPDGNFLLISYEPALRDMSHYGDYSEQEPTHDSMVQIVSPDGQRLFEWTTWGNVPMRQCLKHRFPEDYAHINSATMVGEDILVSLRGCNLVVLLDGETGQTIWSTGAIMVDDEEFIASGQPAPLRITGDPLGSFCGQHSAHLLDGDRLIVYDNHSYCPDENAYGQYSRVAEYRIDTVAGVAHYVREHSMFNSKSVFTTSTGVVKPLDNGNWLIGWGRVPAKHPKVSETGRLYASLSEVNPVNNEVLTTMRFSYRALEHHMIVKPWLTTTDILPAGLHD